MIFVLIVANIDTQLDTRAHTHRQGSPSYQGFASPFTKPGESLNIKRFSSFFHKTTSAPQPLRSAPRGAVQWMWWAEGTQRSVLSVRLAEPLGPSTRPSGRRTRGRRSAVSNDGGSTSGDVDRLKILTQRNVPARWSTSR